MFWSGEGIVLLQLTFTARAHRVRGNYFELLFSRIPSKKKSLLLTVCYLYQSERWRLSVKDKHGNRNLGRRCNIWVSRRLIFKQRRKSMFERECYWWFVSFPLLLQSISKCSNWTDWLDWTENYRNLNILCFVCANRKQGMTETQQLFYHSVFHWSTEKLRAL